MYPHLLMTHSWMRYVLLILLVWAIFKAFQGKSSNAPFNNKLRLFVVIAAHIQLLLGLIMSGAHPDMKTLMQGFMGKFHILGMIIAVVLITIGSAKAKRQSTDQGKWQTLFTWFLISLILILVMIPWPFSPLAQAPWFRSM